jgi:GAF domain-containing protein/CHASE3 domain sensor protein
MTTPNNTPPLETTAPATHPPGRMRRVLRPLGDLSISRKLDIGLGALIVLALLIVLLNALGSTWATENINRIQDLRVPTTLTSAQAQAHLLKMLADIRSYLVLDDPEFRNAYHRDIIDFETDLAQMEELSTNWTNPENKRRLGELQAAFREWSALPDQLFDLHNDALTNQPARRILIEQAQPLFSTISDDIALMIEEQVQREPSAENTALLKDMINLQSSFISLESILRVYLATGSATYKAEYYDFLNQHQSVWNSLNTQRASLSPDQAAPMNDITQNREALLPLPPQIFAALEGERAFEDQFLLKTQATPLADEMLRLLNEMSDNQRVLLQDDLDESNRRLADARSQARIAGLAALAFGLGLALAFRGGVSRPIQRLTGVAAQILAGDLDARARVESGDEVGRLAGTFNDMTDQLRRTLRDLEQHTRDLERRSGYLEASAEVSHAATSILDTDQLIHQVVELILEQFGLYYVGLFLVDDLGEWAVLQAGTGEAGQAMLARGHRIKVGEGMIGWSIANSQARVALEVGQDAVRKPTAELPDTRSEAAIPMRSRERVLGALTVQHTIPGAFGPGAIAVLQTMADQVAVALDNAQLLTASQAALEAERRAYGELSREAWMRLTQGRLNLGYRYSPSGIFPLGKTEVPSGDGGQELPELTLPIRIRENVVGKINAHKPSASGGWTQEEIALLETLVGQLSQALEGAQLYQDTQDRATREHMVGEITSKMRESLDVDTVLQTAVREMHQALGIDQVEIRMGAGLISAAMRDRAGADSI